MPGATASRPVRSSSYRVDARQRRVPARRRAAVSVPHNVARRRPRTIALVRPPRLRRRPRRRREVAAAGRPRCRHDAPRRRRWTVAAGTPADDAAVVAAAAAERVVVVVVA